MKTLEISYDVQCLSLAQHFLDDEPCSDDRELYEKYCHSLAQHIQKAIEDWFSTP